MEQLEFLRKHGCYYAQGRLFGEPMGAGELLAILDAQAADGAHYSNLCAPTVLRPLRLTS
jgi:sensor c-di-GMP phosphodiesterase-like protein